MGWRVQVDSEEMVEGDFEVQFFFCISLAIWLK